MATKNVYVSDSDVVLFERAAELAGGMSTAVAAGLRLYVAQREREQKRNEMTSIEVEVQEGAVVSTKRFVGRPLLRYEVKDGIRAQNFRVYETERGQLAVHARSDANWSAIASPDEENPLWDDPKSWQGEWWKTTDRSLMVYPDVDSMTGTLPDDLVEAIRHSLSKPSVDILDI
jgi:EXLDI family protein